ncbi:MAG: (d)CMP kinase [Prevotellaceae bacterium]|jgi:cytidylate kinase|nr:(d)CMP kinase [Prevotellaceae bacterium]
MKKIIIAIDGFSSCGKSTMAKELAHEIGYIYIDSGAMYRAVTLYCIQTDILKEETIDIQRLREAIGTLKVCFHFNRETDHPDVWLNDVNVEDKIRTMEVSAHVSKIAAFDFVRTAMVAQQQAMGRDKGLVMDGRDIGTVVFPHAELKIFVTASPEVRARRRYDELTAKGATVSLEEILTNIKERDYADQHRPVSPLRQADDAILLDNTHLTTAQQLEWLKEQYQQAIQ